MFRYILSFTAGRGTLFLAPIVIANYLSSVEYGQLEGALASATFLSSLITLGTASLIPVTLLGHATKARIRGIFAHHICVATIALTIAGVLALSVDAAQGMHTAIFVAALTLQGLASTQLKTLGRSNASVLIDAALLGLAAIAAVITTYIQTSHRLDCITAFVIIYIMILWTYYARSIMIPPKENPDYEWINTIKSGIPLMIGGLISSFATSSGRLGIAVLGSPLITADYSVLARVAAIPIVVYQLIVVSRFRLLFTLPEVDANRLCLKIVALVGGAVFVFIFISPSLGNFLGTAFRQSYTSHRTEFNLILSQSVVWAAIALNDLIITRRQIMQSIISYTSTYLIGASLIAYYSFTTHPLSIDYYVAAHSALMAGFFTVQSFAMHRRGIPGIYFWCSTITLYIILLLVVLAVR